MPSQFPAVRVPIPVVILLCLCVVGGVWWIGTRKHDFLSPPSENQLAMVRQKAGASRPPSQDSPAEVNAAPQTAQAVKPIHVSPASGQRDEAPQLADYRTQAVNNPALLAEMARQLETQGKLPRSLLAWERILDSAAPDDERTTEAIQAIKRLRPGLSEWNKDPAKVIAVSLHAGTAKSNAEVLTPVLEEIARDLEKASSGILKITPVVTAGPDIPKSRGAAPVAIWLSGPDADAPSTEVLAFTNGSPEMLRDHVLKTLLRVIRSYLARGSSLMVPELDNPEENPMDSIQFRITRLGWLELGTRLNKTLE